MERVGRLKTVQVRLLVILGLATGLIIIAYLTLIAKFVNTFTIATYNYAENIVLKNVMSDRYALYINDVFDESQYIESFYKAPSLLVAIYEVTTSLRGVYVPFSGTVYFFIFYIMAKLFATQHNRIVTSLTILSFSIYAISHNLHALSISRAELGTAYTFTLLYIVFKSYIKKELNRSLYILILTILISQTFTHYTNFLITTIIILVYTYAMYVITKRGRVAGIKTISHLNLIAICAIFTLIATYNRYVEVGFSSFIQTITNGFTVQLSNLQHILESALTRGGPLTSDNIDGSLISRLLFIDLVGTRLLIALSLYFMFLDFLSKKRVEIGFFILVLAVTTYFGYNIYNIYRIFLLRDVKFPMSAGLVAILIPLYGIFHVNENYLTSKLKGTLYRYVVFSIIILLMLLVAFSKTIAYTSLGTAGNQLHGINYIAESKIADLLDCNRKIRLTGDEVILYYIKHRCESNLEFSNLLIKPYSKENLKETFLILVPKLKTVWSNVWGSATPISDVMNTIELMKHETYKLFDSHIVKLFKVQTC